MIKEDNLTWKEFKNRINSNEDWIYRGQASADWLLESTLKRFSSFDAVRAGDYHNMLVSIRSDERMKTWLIDHELSLPEENPLLMGLLAANNEHIEQMKQLFRYMHNLRHIGFPTPSIDWTQDYLIAAFFAASGVGINKPMAIFRLKIEPSPQSNPFGLNIYKLNADEKSHARERNQKSAYTIAIFQNRFDFMYRKTEMTGADYWLHSYEGLVDLLPNLKIEKYIINDSGDRQGRLDILRELFEEKNISFENIYGITDFLENTVIKDIAIKSILFDGELAFRVAADQLSRYQPK